ncbi:YwmB family TATA-box binding protein [Bacillus coahuilensis]|uniref:YwmB family TATA-box binding protein n=2 Tax=Bacillus coahuilensis TaxID=408580 RepID=UPI001ED97DB5|nr:YwmB family TATA-box binding protein [Bacillus coahuilensis]
MQNGLVKKKKDQMKYSAIIPSSFGTEKVTWILYTHDPSASYAIYELHGDFESTQQMKKASDYFHRKITTLFNKNPQIFSCIKGVFNDKLDNVLQKQVNHLVVNLEAEKIEEVSENEFYSLSSYSTHFNEAISLNKQQKMNMQLGLRETGLGLTTTFVIGTPILTTEY